MVQRVRHVLVLFVVLLTVARPVMAKELGPRGLPCADPLSGLRRGNFTLEVGTAHLQGGRDCLRDPGSPCEWAVELSRAEAWGANQRFLLAIVNADHLLGSGAWDSVFLYVCRGDIYVQVFASRFLYGAKVELGMNADFWITAGVWRPSDPTCCPSSERRTHYSWNGKQNRFIVTQAFNRSITEPK